MLLLIDLGDFLFNSHIKHGVLSDKEAVYAFVDAYNKLYEIRANILTRVEAVMFMNSSGYLLEIRKEIFPKSKKLLSRAQKTNKFLSKIFNQELEVAIIDLVTSGDHFALLNDLQQPALQKFGIIFFDTLLTNSMAKFLIRCRNVLGYRKIKNGRKFIWEKIENIEKYLTIISSLHQKFIGYEKIKENYIEIGKNQHAGFLIDLKKFHEYKHYNIHVIKFEKNNRDGLIYFLDKLNTEIGKFITHYCKMQGKEIPKSERLIIMDFEKLDEDERREILSRVSEDQYDNSIIIIIVKNKIDVKDFPKINVRTEFSYADVKGINRLSLKIISDRIEMFDKIVKDYRSVISNLSIQEEQKAVMLKKIDDYSIGGNLSNADAVNFWYDKVELELNNSENIKRNVEEWGQILYGSEEMIHYQIDLDLERDIWIIKKNNVQLKPIQFSGSKGIKYVVYLFKHYSDGKIINYQKLEGVVENWGKKKVKSDNEFVKVKIGNIASNLSNLFDTATELNKLKDFVVITEKGSGCYFYKNDSIIIELGNFKIPDAV